MPGSRCKPEASDAVSQILVEPQQGQHVFDVCGVEKLQSTEFDERDVPARELDFERTAVTGCPEQNSLLFEEGAGLPVLRDAFDDEARLASSRTETNCGFVADARSVRPPRAPWIHVPMTCLIGISAFTQRE
jgi:hypothetical protein